MYAQLTHRTDFDVSFDVRFEEARVDAYGNEHPAQIACHTVYGPYLSMSVGEARALRDALSVVLGACETTETISL
jgi:hypothetical protein